MADFATVGGDPLFYLITPTSTGSGKAGDLVGARHLGRVRRPNEAARAMLLASEDARRGVWLTLVSDLAQAYFPLLALEVVG
jgi:multidrug efflux system outer membrane protein